MTVLFKNNDGTRRYFYTEAYQSRSDRDFNTFVQTQIAPNVNCVSECPHYIIFSITIYILKKGLESRPIVHCAQKLVFKCLAVNFSVHRVKLICKNSVGCKL